MSVNTLMEQLKSQTREEHEKVDQLVSHYDPFASQRNYNQFLQLQETFHRIVEEIYKNETLNDKLPQLKDLARYRQVRQDMEDLGVEPIEQEDLPRPVGEEALGWLYCAEGSNLGAAFLLKGAATLGLNANYGARHLAPHEEGRAKHWRAFAALFDTKIAPEVSTEKVILGAKKAFTFYRELAKTRLGLT
ncbi:MAG: biliverdin-producing heme oxygenase [Neisseriaceae bacterium]